MYSFFVTLGKSPQIPLKIAVQFKTNPKCCEMLSLTLLVRPSFKFKSLKVLALCKEKNVSVCSSDVHDYFA